MDTIGLIELLEDQKTGASGRNREISFYFQDNITGERYFMGEPDISVGSTGDGICGAEICLDILGDVKGVGDLNFLVKEIIKRIQDYISYAKECSQRKDFNESTRKYWSIRLEGSQDFLSMIEKIIEDKEFIVEEKEPIDPWVRIQGNRYLKSSITRVGKRKTTDGSHTAHHYLVIEAGGLKSEYKFYYEKDIEEEIERILSEIS